ncbi:hypothetical protein [Demequina phytophila]|uniref:hypothetical protein n=1 Tax=Demequina phytophila TaxID=1638981 RepID=UPI0007815F87|nr:hypothetical protein [Demequina phytophila]
MTDGRAGWLEVLKAPKVWIPAAAAVAVIAVSVGLIMTTAARRDDAVAGVAASSSPAASAPVTSEAGDAEVVVAAGSSTPSPSPSAEPTVDGATSEPIPAGDDDLPSTALAACAPSPATVTPIAREDGVLQSDVGATTTAVTPKPTQDFSAFVEPAFSADSTRLVIRETGEGRDTVRVFDAATMGQVAALVSEDAATFAWDATGTLLATARVVDDWLVVELVDPASGEAMTLVRFFSMEPQSLSWSTDGACLALSSRSMSVPTSGEGRVGVHKITIIRVADGLSSHLGGGAFPTFAPDGGLTFRSAEGSGPVRLMRAAPATFEVSPLGAGAGLGNQEQLYGSEIVPAPDGTEVAYLDRASEGRALRIASTWGSSDREVAGLQVSRARIVGWAPDASTVMVKRHHGSQRTDLALVDVASGRMTVLDVPLTTGEWVAGGAFTADGSGVLVAVNKWREPNEHNSSRLVLVTDDGASQVGDKQRGWAHSAPTWSPSGTVLVTSAGQVLTREVELDGSLVVTRR